MHNRENIEEEEEDEGEDKKNVLKSAHKIVLWSKAVREYIAQRQMCIS